MIILPATPAKETKMKPIFISSLKKEVRDVAATLTAAGITNQIAGYAVMIAIADTTRAMRSLNGAN